MKHQLLIAVNEGEYIKRVYVRDWEAFSVYGLRLLFGKLLCFTNAYHAKINRIISDWMKIYAFSANNNRNFITIAYTLHEDNAFI